MRTVPAAPVMPEDERVEELPERVREALGELAGAAKEGLLALSVGVGLGVLHELMEAEVDEGRRAEGPARSRALGGAPRPRGRRGHARWSAGAGQPPARADGGRRTAPGRSSCAPTGTSPRAISSLPWCWSGMLVGVSTRRYARTGEPVGSDVDERARSTSKSAVSREFVSRTREHLIELMSRPLEDLRLAVLMLDGVELKGRCCVVALGIDTDGVKHPLGLWDGSTENATVATTLLTNLVERGLDVEQGVLVVRDGAKALRKAVRDVLGIHTPVQRCIRHRSETCSSICPSATARSSAAASEPRGRLKRTLASTNSCESMIETVRRTSRNVKRWQSGDMCLRWTAAGMLEAERQFRKIIGHADLAKLAIAVERDVAAKRAADQPYTPVATAAPEVTASPA